MINARTKFASGLAQSKQMSCSCTQQQIDVKTRNEHLPNDYQVKVLMWNDIQYLDKNKEADSDCTI